jgi:hypothetical protein
MEIAPHQPAEEPPRRRHRPSKPQLLTRAALDGRTGAARYFDRLVGDIERDLGGSDQLSAIEHELVEAFAGASVMLAHLNTKVARGEEVDPAEHSQAASTLVRIATRLGLQRRARDIGPTLGDLLRGSPP